MIMDTFKVFGFHGKTPELPKIAYFYVNIPYKIFDKFRVVISPLGDELLVLALYNRINRAGSGVFHQADYVFDPEKRPQFQFHGNHAPLIVRAALGNCF
jgi:hypothetical protein